MKQEIIITNDTQTNKLNVKVEGFTVIEIIGLLEVLKKSYIDKLNATQII